MALTIQQARKIALSAQGLASHAPFGSGPEAALNVVKHLGYVQIDTISVIERAHHHVIWSRVPDYQPEHLELLLEKERSVFEYWSHAASYLPISDYRYSLPLMKAIASGKKSGWFEPDHSEMKRF